MAIISVGQENSAFFMQEGNDPNKAGKFLSFNPTTNEYERVSYKEMAARAKEEAVDNTPTKAGSYMGDTIGDVMKMGTSEGTASLSRATLGSTPSGSIHMAATGFGTALSIKDILATSSQINTPIGALMTALSGWDTYSSTTKGLTRAEVFEQAKTPGATVADVLAAYNQEPSWKDYAKAALGLGVAVVTGNVPGVVGSALNVGSTISADIEAEQALTRAGAMERSAASSTQPMYGGYGYVNTVANFNARQQANMEAASTDSRTPTYTTISDVMKGASVSTSFSESRKSGYDTITAYRDDSGDVISRTDFSEGGSFSQNISENQRTAERRAEEGYTPSTSAERRGIDTTRENKPSRPSVFGLGGSSGGSSGGDFGVGGIGYGEAGSVGHGGGIGL